MISASILHNSWFHCAVDLFMDLYDRPFTNSDTFFEKASFTATQIQKLALEKFDESEKKLKFYADDAWKNLVKFPYDQKIGVLVNSSLFKHMVNTKKKSLKNMGPQYFKSTIIPTLLDEYGKDKKIDVTHIKDNNAAIKWLCSAIQSMQTPYEMHEIAATLQHIPPEQYAKIQLVHLHVEKEILFKELCNQVINLLDALQNNSEEKKLWPVETKALNIFKKYENLIDSFSGNLREYTIRNIIISLQIRCRQLPYAEELKKLEAMNDQMVYTYSFNV